MKRVVAIADRIAQPAMWLVALLHLLFLASLFAVILTAPAGAQPVCGGKDLFAELKQSDPAMLTKLEAQAAETPNGEGILWKIEKDGAKPSWLFGTIHMTDPRVTALDAEAEKAFDATDRLVIETTDVLDEAKLLGEMAKRPDLMMYTDGGTLTDRISAEDLALLSEGLKARGIPIDSVIKMKPWMLLAAVAMPACEQARKAAGEKILDAKLAADATAAGKEVSGLETAIEQMEAMASLPMDFHIRGLIDTLKLGARADDVVETMIVLYKQGRTGMYWPLFEATLSDGAGLGEGYADFEQTIIIKRNQVMADRAEPLLAEGGVFMAVGALHLPGEKGIVELLRAKGYRVDRAAAL
jgi:uncharacterized protein YbaP (TraB family)